MPNERLKSIFTLFKRSDDKANEIFFFLSSKFASGNNISMRIYMAFCQRNQRFESTHWKMHSYLFQCLRSCGKSIFWNEKKVSQITHDPFLESECQQKVKTLSRHSHAFSSLTYPRGWRYEKDEATLPANSWASNYPCMGQCEWRRLNATVWPLR